MNTYLSVIHTTSIDMSSIHVVNRLRLSIWIQKTCMSTSPALRVDLPAVRVLP